MSTKKEALKAWSEMITVKDLADVKGVTPQSIRNRVRKGTLPPCDVKSGNEMLWYPSTIKAFATGGKDGD